MNIEDISHKALEYLHTHKKPPTPHAYFQAFYEVMERDLASKHADSSELDWRGQWLKKFNKDIQIQLKGAQNPDEFIDKLAAIMKDSQELQYMEHTRELKNLSRLLLGNISDVFSINAKNRFPFLFGVGGLNKIGGTRKLIGYWRSFRTSGVHFKILKKLVGIVTYILRTPQENGKVSKEALELSSVLLMHPENLIDVHLLERIEKLLGIREAQWQLKDDMAQKYIVVFKLAHLSFVEKKSDFDVDKAIDKAMNVLKSMCLSTLEDATLIGHYHNGFAISIQQEKSEVLEKIEPITKQLHTQKFSYQGVLFTFDFDIEVLEYKTFDTLEELNTALREKLHTSHISIETKDIHAESK